MASVSSKHNKGLLFRYGEIVWCKLKGYPEWPARVLDPEQSKHLYEKREAGMNLVIFYRDDSKPGEIAWVPDSALSDFGEKLDQKEKTSKTWKNKGLGKGLKESFEKAKIHHKRFLTADPGTDSEGEEEPASDPASQMDETAKSSPNPPAATVATQPAPESECVAVPDSLPTPATPTDTTEAPSVTLTPAESLTASLPSQPSDEAPTLANGLESLHRPGVAPSDEAVVREKRPQDDLPETEPVPKKPMKGGKVLKK